MTLADGFGEVTCLEAYVTFAKYTATIGHVTERWRWQLAYWFAWEYGQECGV